MIIRLCLVLASGYILNRQESICSEYHMSNKSKKFQVIQVPCRMRYGLRRSLLRGRAHFSKHFQRSNNLLIDKDLIFPEMKAFQSAPESNAEPWPWPPRHFLLFSWISGCLPKWQLKRLLSFLIDTSDACLNLLVNFDLLFPAFPDDGNKW